MTRATQAILSMMLDVSAAPRGAYLWLAFTIANLCRTARRFPRTTPSAAGETIKANSKQGARLSTLHTCGGTKLTKSARRQSCAFCELLWQNMLFLLWWRSDIPSAVCKQAPLLIGRIAAQRRLPHSLSICHRRIPPLAELHAAISRCRTPRAPRGAC